MLELGFLSLILFFLELFHVVYLFIHTVTIRSESIYWTLMTY